MKSTYKYFTGSAYYALASLAVAYFLGGASAVLIVAILGVLETSLSFDNAVVNAKTLKDMDDKWRHRFLTWGMAIAVFGMRVVFPLAIVSATAEINPVSVVKMAIYEPDQYASLLTGAHVQIAAFGGAFLCMVFLKFFIDAEKDVHWIGFVEKNLGRLGRLEGAQILLTLAVLIAVGAFLPNEEKLTFVLAGIAGIMTYIAADGVGAFFGGEEGEQAGHEAVVQVAKAGLAGFLYLELLDASFSFDGVVGAFALSNSLFIIALGLGVGAMFVRSLTLFIVDKDALGEYRYLEHGAFWAIGALATMMFVGLHVEIPEAVTGLIGAGLIGVAFLSSVLSNRKEAAAEAIASKA